MYIMMEATVHSYHGGLDTGLRAYYTFHGNNPENNHMR